MKKLVNFTMYFIIKYKQSQTKFAATFLAYYLLLAFIPMLIFITQILSAVTPNLQQIIFTALNELPSAISQLLTPVISGIFNMQSSSLSTIAIISALWLGSRGFVGLIDILHTLFDIHDDEKYHIAQKIPFFNRIFAVIYTIAFIGILVSLLVLNVFNQQIMQLLRELLNDSGFLSAISNILIDGLGNLIAYTLTILIFAFFFKFSTAFYKHASIPFDAAFFGSVVTTIGMYGITIAYKYFSSFIFRSEIYYGSLGGILITLLWLLFICQSIVFGAVFIRCYIEVFKDKKQYVDLMKS